MPLTLVLVDGTQCEITNMFDVDGEDTDDPEAAHSVVAKMPDGKWIAQEVGPEMWQPAKRN